jgi:hypothetical protein
MEEGKGVNGKIRRREGKERKDRRGWRGRKENRMD